MISRWVSKDPILFRGKQTNLYAYVGNDPVNRHDPKGTDGPFVWGSMGSPIAGSIEGEAIAVFGVDSNDGYYGELIQAAGIEIDAGAIGGGAFGGYYEAVGPSCPIHGGRIGLAETSVGRGNKRGGINLVGGFFATTDSFGPYVGVSGGALGEHAGLGVGYSFDLSDVQRFFEGAALGLTMLGN